MNFLHATQNRVALARNNEGGFTLTEMLMYISLVAILIVIGLNALGTMNLVVKPMIQDASGTGLKPAQMAAKDVYEQLDAFTNQYPDTAPTKALMTSRGYLGSIPANVVFAFHSYGGPSSPQRCVIAYLTDDTSGGFTVDNPAAFDSLYGSGSIGQDCKHQVAGSSDYVPDWDSK